MGINIVTFFSLIFELFSDMCKQYKALWADQVQILILCFYYSVFSPAHVRLVYVIALNSKKALGDCGCSIPAGIQDQYGGALGNLIWRSGTKWSSRSLPPQAILWFCLPVHNFSLQAWPSVSQLLSWINMIRILAASQYMCLWEQLWK